jgi:hypothetical protein
LQTFAGYNYALQGFLKDERRTSNNDVAALRNIISIAFKNSGTVLSSAICWISLTEKKWLANIPSLHIGGIKPVSLKTT